MNIFNENINYIYKIINNINLHIDIFNMRLYIIIK